MADTNIDRTGPKTPPPGSTFPLAPELKSTPNAAGSAVVSEHLKTLGVQVDDLSPWIARDVKDHSRCEVDTMLEELTYTCLDPSKPLSNISKSSLLDACLHAVLPICNDSTIQANLSAFVAPQVETKSYTPFVGAANQSLLRLSELVVPGLIPSKDNGDLSDILFHHNDHPMFQTHQGETSERKPDVVIIPWKTARTARNDGDIYEKNDMYLHRKLACAKPDNNFKWPETVSTVEFKRTKSTLDAPPSGYEVRDYNVPTSHQYMEFRKETPKPEEATDSRPVPAPAPRPSNEPKRESARLKLQGKRPSDSAPPNQPESKRPKSNKEKPDVDDEKEKTIDPIVQNGLYAAEMFAPHIARRHVISFLVDDDVIYVWYFDRQNAIQCSGINFVQDLPRFLVLLLALQRMPYAQWGYNPLFEPQPGFSGEIKIKDEEKGVVDLKFKLQSEERMTHSGLRGRATTVYPVESNRLSTLLREKPSQNPSNEMVAKLYWPEVSRESEADILERVCQIAEKESKVKGHVPEMVWFHKFEETSTAHIRRALGIPDSERGSRVLYIIIFRKLSPITTLSEQEFLTAWWQAVLCHRVLWEKGVHHRDISPSNLMFYRTSSGVVIGVLNDYDLSSTRTVPTGQERTGTVPFMAIALLTQAAIAGKVEHLYMHDAESFIWVLTWVCLRYEDGKLMSQGRPLDEWLRADATQCRKEKNDFMATRIRTIHPSASHQENWKVARKCCSLIYSQYGPDEPAEMTDGEVFLLWLQSKVKGHLPDDLLFGA